MSFALAGLVAVALGLSSVALAAGGVTGTYTTTIKSPTEVKGKWAVTFGKTGGYVVALNGKAMARGKYSASATTITLREPAGCGGTGTYTWKRSGKFLMFTRKHESASCGHGRQSSHIGSQRCVSSSRRRRHRAGTRPRRRVRLTLRPGIADPGLISALRAGGQPGPPGPALTRCRERLECSALLHARVQRSRWRRSISSIRTVIAFPAARSSSRSSEASPTPRPGESRGAPRPTGRPSAHPTPLAVGFHRPRRGICPLFGTGFCSLGHVSRRRTVQGASGTREP